MKVQPTLKELQPPVRLTEDFFNAIINRIECTKPLPGENINITQKADGIVIASSFTATTFSCNVVTLNVCSNGVPDTLLVLKVNTYTASQLDVMYQKDD